METKELVITTSMPMSSEHSSITLWDFTHNNSSVPLHRYKKGGRVRPNGLCMLDKDYLITADADRPVLHAWLLERDKPINVILPRQANCLAVCPNSVYLAAGIESRLYLWHIGSGKLVSVEQRHFQPISVIKFSQDGVYICVGGEDGSLLVYNFPHLMGFESNLPQLEVGYVESLYSRVDHNQVITDLVIGNFGEDFLIATASSDGALNIYTLNYGELLKSVIFPEELTSVVFRPNCWGLFVGTTSGHICQVEVEDPLKPVFERGSLTLAGHKEKITCLAINSDGTILASGSADYMVRMWHISNLNLWSTIEHKGIITNILFTFTHSNFFVKYSPTKMLAEQLEKDFEPGDDMFDVVLRQKQDQEIHELGLMKEKVEEVFCADFDTRGITMLLYTLNMVPRREDVKRFLEL